MTLSQSELQGRVTAALSDGGLLVSAASSSGSQPLCLVLDDRGRAINAHFYIRNITHGGRGRTEREYRIQLTGRPLQNSERAVTFLLGYFEPRDVFVSFDPSVHLAYGTSPSLQVGQAALDTASRDGICRFRRQRRGGAEQLIAVRSDHLADLVREVASGRDGEPVAGAIWTREAGPVQATAVAAPPSRVSEIGDLTTVNIRPGVGILALFPHMNYRPWFALAEFVDNSLASYQACRDQLAALYGGNYQFRVVVEVDGADGGLIRIWDNAGGIGLADYQRAFVTAEPPPHTTGLSEFGIGMKSAGCWFAPRWRVSTRALDEHVERVVEFDVPAIVHGNVTELGAKTQAPTNPLPFTEVKLWDLYKPPQTKTISKMRDHLASIYREFIDSGEMRLEFNGTPLRYEHPPILVAPRWDQEDGPKVRWRKSIRFTLPTGERVSGFAGLRETGSTKYAGFALFRNRRLVVGSSDETYRPDEVFGGTNSYRYQRLFGELHLSGFDISHTKDGFIWGDREQAFLTALRKDLDLEPLPLLAQAERYRSRKADPSVERAADRALAGTAAALGAAAGVVQRQTLEAPWIEAPPERHPDGLAVAQRVLDLTVSGTVWQIVIDVTNDPAQTDWLTIADAPPVGPMRAPRRLGIRVSLTSPFMRRFSGATAEDLEPLLRLAAGVAMAEVAAREAGVKQAGTIRRHLNELLATALSKE